jgi:hypothetical protein
LDEVARKGYQAVAFFIRRTEIETFRLLSARAYSLGLRVQVLTGYMRYENQYLAEHPDQALVSAAEPGEGLSRDSGCPFNPQFKERYFAFLCDLARSPGVSRISVNDEAYLGNACYCEVCQQDYREQWGREIPRKANPQAQDWEDIHWRRFLKWKIDRWNQVHGEMAQVIREVNPEVEAVFQTSPYVDLWANPWFTGVDLAGMVEHLGGISADPYHTFHRAPFFQPAEVYLSEWSRFVRGLVPEGKSAEIVVQAFSHPTFTRPLGEADGL